MRIILSPAKKMNVDTDSLPWRDLPVFLPEAQHLADALRAMDADARKKLWQCSDAIAVLNEGRLANMDLRARLTPAILAYGGIQYQHMAPGVFTRWEYDYLQAYVRILSGLYGILKPLDGVTPYRLEMQARLKTEAGDDLYSYWGGRIAAHLCAETNCIFNLASREYSLCVSRYLPDSVRFITCVFGEERDGRVVEKGTLCKMARGEMVRYMAEHLIEDPACVQAFDRLHYRFDPARSSEERYVFLREKTESR